jgi:hypothetical protein
MHLTPLTTTQRNVICSASIMFAAALSLTLLDEFRRVGNGNQYLMTYFAWLLEFSPQPTEYSNSVYDKFADAYASVQASQYFHINQFWFYSFLASLAGQIPYRLGMEFSPPTAFATVHAALAAIACGYAAYKHRITGALATAIILFGSPAFWFANKIHPEFVIITLGIMAICAIWNGSLLLSALLIAIASTLSPMLAFASLLILGSWVWTHANRQIALSDAVLFLGSFLILLLRTAYYFKKHGWFTVDRSHWELDAWNIGIQRATSGLFNLDIGLLPNWPLGAVVIASATGLVLLRRASQSSARTGTGAVVFAVAAYFAACVVAQMAESNLNHGGTVYISRYATLYLCLFFPPLAILLDHVANSWRIRPSVTCACVIVALITGIGFNTRYYHSFQNEAYLSPSPAATAAWRWVPEIYRPPPEIFLERSTGAEGAPLRNASAVVAPDCRTIAFRPIMVNAEFDVLQSHCAAKYDPENLRVLLERLLQINRERILDTSWSNREYGAWVFTRISNAQAVDLIAD